MQNQPSLGNNAFGLVHNQSNMIRVPAEYAVDSQVSDRYSLSGVCLEATRLTGLVTGEIP